VVSAIMLCGFIVTGCGSSVNPEGQSTRAAQWRLIAVSDRGHTIRVAYKMGDPVCEELDRIETAETQSTVAVTVVLRRHRDVKQCGDVLNVRAASLKLKQPLGSRRLVDGRTGERKR
jgi:hypothetical protein